MEFKLRMNPGKEARQFLESRLDALRNAGIEEGLARLKEDIFHIFSGRYDKLKRDSRFRKVFLNKQPDLRGEPTSLGETLIGAFSVLDRVYDERLAGRGKTQSRSEIEQEHFDTKLKALEDIFAGDITVFEQTLIKMFWRHTYQTEKLKGKKIQEVEEGFRKFAEESERLLSFFFCLDEFNRLNRMRADIDRDKKSSLSMALEDEIQRGCTLANLERQITICRKLEHLSRRLVEISQGHDPLSGVRRVLDEVYSAEGNQSAIKGLLEKFRKYYEFELEQTREVLVFKRVIHLNSGSRQARANRKKWLDSMSHAEIERLVNLLEVNNGSGGRLSREQKARQELFQVLRKKLDGDKAEEADKNERRNTLGEVDINLLVLRLDNVSLLEDQISAGEERIENYRRQNKVDYQNTVISSYNDNIKHLSQCLYFYLELSKISNPALEIPGREISKELRRQMEELDAGFEAEKSGAVESSAEANPGENAAKVQSAAPQAKSTTAVEPEIGKEQDPRGKAALLAEKLNELPDAAKIKPLKELALFGSLEALPHIRTLYRSRSGFLHKLARNTMIKIILRELKEAESNRRMGIQQKKKLIGLVQELDSRYSYLEEMEIVDRGTREKVFDILIREDKAFTARAITEIIVDKDERVRATAVKLIADMLDEKESGLLLKLISDPDPRVRANVIESLEEIGNHNVLGILMKYKYDKDNRVRANAIKALWNFGHRDVQGALQDMLLSFDPKMRASATWVVGEIGHNQPELKNLLNAAIGDNDEMVKRNLERALRKIASREEGLRVLVVDDDEQLCRKISRGLTADGYKTSVAHDGRAALSAAAELNPHAILLDLRMPVMNGLETLKKLRAGEQTRETPVIVFCDFNSSLLIDKARKAGADSYLIKPCSYDEVKRKLRSCI